MLFKGSKCKPMSTQANEGLTEAEAPPMDENVVKQQLDKASTQRKIGLLSPPPEDLSDPSDDDQRSPKLEGASSPGELNQPQDLSVGQIDQDLSAAEKSNVYPTAPSSPKECEDLPEDLAGLRLDGKGETQHGQAPEKPLESQDPNLEPLRLSPDDAVTPSSSALAVSQVETEEKLPEESECSVQPLASIVPVPEIDEAIVPSLDVARNVESEQSEAEDEQSDDQELHLSEGEAEQVAPGEDVAEKTRELEELGIPRIRHAPGSYFYSTTATYEGISRAVDMAATGMCIANTPRGTRCQHNITDLHADICSWHNLHLRGHLFRHELPHFHEHIEYQDLVYHDMEQGNVVMASRDEFEAFMDDFHPLIKQNLYNLIRDFLLLLGTDPDRERDLSESPSVIARYYRQKEDDTDERIGCEKVGQVYMLVPSPRAMDRDRMWFAGGRVRDHRDSLPVKIGQSEHVARRFTEHRARCDMQSNPSLILPFIKYVELLERILHELFVAHQHDLLCKCGGASNLNGKNNIEMFWFERLSGGLDPHEDFEGIVDALRSDIEKCQKFVKLRGDCLSLVHVDTTI